LKSFVNDDANPKWRPFEQVQRHSCTVPILVGFPHEVIGRRYTEFFRSLLEAPAPSRAEQTAAFRGALPGCFFAARMTMRLEQQKVRNFF